MMTMAELVEDARSRIAEVSDSFFSDDTIKRWLNEAQQIAVRRTKVLQRKSIVTTGVGENAYPMSSDFWLPRLVVYDGDELRPVTVEELERNSFTTGRPYAYAVWAKTILLYPAPSQEKKLTVYYYAWPRVMRHDSDIPEIPEAFHNILPTFAAYRAKQADQQVAEADRLFAEFQAAVAELLQSDYEDQVQLNVVRDVSRGYGIGGMVHWP